MNDATLATLKQRHAAETENLADVAELLGMTFEQAEKAWHGERITDEQWVAYQCVWRRSVPRLSDVAKEHDRCEGMCGCLAPRPAGVRATVSGF